jgi:hypothetical protein
VKVASHAADLFRHVSVDKAAFYRCIMDVDVAANFYPVAASIASSSGLSPKGQTPLQPGLVAGGNVRHSLRRWHSLTPISEATN